MLWILIAANFNSQTGYFLDVFRAIRNHLSVSKLVVGVCVVGWRRSSRIHRRLPAAPARRSLYCSSAAEKKPIIVIYMRCSYAKVIRQSSSLECYRLKGFENCLNSDNTVKTPALPRILLSIWKAYLQIPHPSRPSRNDIGLRCLFPFPQHITSSNTDPQ